MDRRTKLCLELESMFHAAQVRFDSASYDQLSCLHRRVRSAVNFFCRNFAEVRCPDCGKEGEIVGHQDCQYPKDHE